MGMKVYIAAPFNRREEARSARNVLMKKGYVSVSRWIDNHLTEKISDQQKRTEALEDIKDIQKSMRMIFINGKSTAGGMHVEMGYALSEGIPIYLVGKPSSVFHHLPQVTCFNCVEDIPNAY